MKIISMLNRNDSPDVFIHNANFLQFLGERFAPFGDLSTLIY